MATISNNFGSQNTTGDVVFSARDLAVLNEIATVVSSATDISDVYSAFSALVGEVIEWDGIIVVTPWDDARNFMIRVREGSLSPGRRAGDLFEIQGSLYEELVRTRETQNISVVEGQTAEWALKYPGIRDSLVAGFRSFMAAPLISHGNLLGGLHVQSYKADAFSEHDRMIFERIGIFLGPTIERFNAYEELKRDDLHAKSMLRMGRLLLGAADLGDVFDSFIDELRMAMEVDRFAIAVAQPDGETITDRYMYGIPVDGYEVGKVHSMESLEPNGLDVTSHGYILAPGMLDNADPVASPGLHANNQAGLKSAMFAGLRSEGKLVGTMNVKSVRLDAYAAHKLEYFEQLADHVAASIDRTRSHESELELNRAARERSNAQQEAVKIVEVTRAKERLLSSASHELRTPLTGILAFVDLLARNRDGNLNDKQLRYLSIVRRNAEDLSGKVNSLIDHSARNSEQLNIKLERFRLAPMLQEALTDAAPKMAELGQSHRVDVDESIEAVGDRRHLLTAIGHLIDNAIQYTPRGSEVRIAGEVNGRYLEMSVSDEGAGISEDHAAGIFDPFERGELTGMADRPGAGLGLTYVRAVAIGHGGDASYEPSSGGGAKFMIQIPVRVGSDSPDQ
jgi:signal transduction histidine kinase